MSHGHFNEETVNKNVSHVYTLSQSLAVYCMAVFVIFGKPKIIGKVDSAQIHTITVEAGEKVQWLRL